MARDKKKHRTKNLQPEDVLAGRVKVNPLDLYRLIHQVNPTNRSLSRQEKLRRYYADSHIFLHPSQLTQENDQEGVPNSMLEAIATGLPVLATRHGGIPEAVEHGAAGMLSAERDVDGLLAHMEELAGDLGRWVQLGRRASADVRENFEQAAQIKRLEDVYRELLEGAGP